MGEGFQMAQRRAWRERSVGGGTRLQSGLKASLGTCSLSWGQLGALGRGGTGQGEVCSLESHHGSGLQERMKAGLWCPCRALCVRRALWVRNEAHWGLWWLT